MYPIIYTFINVMFTCVFRVRKDHRVPPDEMESKVQSVSQAHPAPRAHLERTVIRLEKLEKCKTTAFCFGSVH